MYVYAMVEAKRVGDGPQAIMKKSSTMNPHQHKSPYHKEAMQTKQRYNQFSSSIGRSHDLFSPRSLPSSGGVEFAAPFGEAAAETATEVGRDIRRQIIPEHYGRKSHSGLTSLCGSYEKVQEIPGKLKTECRNNTNHRQI